MAEVDDLLVIDDNNTGRWPEGMPASSVNNAGRADEGLLARWYKDTNGSIVSTGASNAYTVNLNRTGLSAITDGFPIAFTANTAATGAATLTVISGATTIASAKSIRKNFDIELEDGDIVASQKVMVVYDIGNDVFQLVSALPTGVQTTQANVFKATQTIRSTDAGSAAAPLLIFDRNSASPADNDFIGGMWFDGRNDAITPEVIRYASFGAQILDVTDGTEDGRGILRAYVDGTDTDILTYGPGVQVGAPTGGDQGAGTINTTGAFKNGVEYLGSDFDVLVDQAIPASTDEDIVSSIDIDGYTHIFCSVFEGTTISNAGLHIVFGDATDFTTNVTLDGGSIDDNGSFTWATTGGMALTPVKAAAVLMKGGFVMTRMPTVIAENWYGSGWAAWQVGGIIGASAAGDLTRSGGVFATNKTIDRVRLKTTTGNFGASAGRWAVWAR